MPKLPKIIKTDKPLTTEDTKEHKGRLENLKSADVKHKVENIILNFLIFSVPPCLRGENCLSDLQIA